MNPRLFIPRLKLMLHKTIPTTIISATQRCNIVATLFWMVTTLFQHLQRCVENRAVTGLHKLAPFVIVLVTALWIDVSRTC